MPAHHAYHLHHLGCSSHQGELQAVMISELYAAAVQIFSVQNNKRSVTINMPTAVPHEYRQLLQHVMTSAGDISGGRGLPDSGACAVGCSKANATHVPAPAQRAKNQKATQSVCSRRPPQISIGSGRQWADVQPAFMRNMIVFVDVPKIQGK